MSNWNHRGCSNSDFAIEGGNWNQKPCSNSDFDIESGNWNRRGLLRVAIETIGVFVAVYLFYCKRRVSKYNESKDIESSEHKEDEEMAQKENLMIFQGGEDLTICHILDAPSEVIGKSNYGTLYKALLQRSNKVSLLRFLKLMCTARGEELDKMIHFLGRIRNPNLVPLLGFYTGPRGEKLLLHPFYRHESLTQFIRGLWQIIHCLNCKLDYNSDRSFLLNPTTGQEMLESSAAQGYKALELIKIE
ncbi:putative kinase-like protein TMKL1 [Glycine soja]|uniref:putative kinase-like protein TMKL1 n=1 Tax=Glycine soja TaxID=3848 RepID=UPI00103D0060|nr:putative kinase-like protein TMKL1 [Glycine soja]